LSTQADEPESFLGARLKIERANKHIDEVNASLRAFLNTNFYSLVVESKPETGQHHLILRITTPAPPDIPLIIGDAIHNLHSALDLAACEIVTRSGGTPTRATKFPFREKRQELEGAIKHGKVEIALPGSGLVPLILEVIAPYKGGNDPLYAIHDLDITDKHQLLITTISVTQLRHVNLTAGPMTMTDCTLTVGEGGELNILRTDQPFQVQLEGAAQPAFAVLFRDGHFKGRPVIPTLIQLRDVVSCVVEALEQTYFAGSQP
jgi:hypothetical protein